MPTFPLEAKERISSNTEYFYLLFLTVQPLRIAGAWTIKLKLLSNPCVNLKYCVYKEGQWRWSCSILPHSFLYRIEHRLSSALVCLRQQYSSGTVSSFVVIVEEKQTNKQKIRISIWKISEKYLKFFKMWNYAILTFHISHFFKVGCCVSLLFSNVYLWLLDIIGS